MNDLGWNTLYKMIWKFNRVYQRSSKHEGHEVGSRFKLKIEKAGYTLIPD